MGHEFCKPQGYHNPVIIQMYDNIILIIHVLFNAHLGLNHWVILVGLLPNSVARKLVFSAVATGGDPDSFLSRASGTWLADQ